MTRLRVLQVEDSPHDAELIQRELKRGGIDADVNHVTTEAAFCTALERTQFDIILADYNIPGFDGMIALDIATKAAPDTPLVFISGSIGEERAVELLRRGAADYIMKDRLSRLATAVMRALAERGERRLRSQTLEALRISQERFLLAAQATRDVIWDWAVDQERVFVNDALRTEWGYPVGPTGVTMEWLRAQIEPRDSARVAEDFAAAIASREARWDGQYRFRRADGRYGYVHDRALILRDENGRAVRAIGAMQDITARTEAERQLEREQRVSSLGRTAAVIAHEFNNVLMGIQPFAEIISRKSTEEKMQKAASQIVHSVRRGKRVTQTILRFAQPSEPVLKVIELAPWFERLLPELRAIVGHGITVDVTAADPALTCRCDAAQLQQVVTNLVINARDAMPNGGRISIATTDRRHRSDYPFGSVPDGMTVITVTDDGAGMTREILDNIFSPLFTTKSTGTGLGLAVAEQIVTRHGGAIHVSSTPGQGTTFFLLLPSAPIEPAALEVQPVKKNLLVGRVLIVDDDQSVSRGISALLEGEGVKVRVVDRGADAVIASSTFQPDAVILDWGLPDIDGSAVFEMLQKSSPGLPTVFSTGHADESSLQRYLSTPHVSFLRKPYSLQTLLGALEAVMASGGGRHE